ncbi:BZ3500_MvSof-1268-A1-R1_C095g00525 [Microbotryum saponariae]|uniref:BZ3500_MvSof-1268-A1-R1_C095g00525 protein n=1 Tax=Microbotryum saponariae TaxID=289078 RepID=A0A2X0N9M6_9BASI|nr:BZ3500_MvSof-1268-A1-R1_C095g00525 [Microbotryum saponariae]
MQFGDTNAPIPSTSYLAMFQPCLPFAKIFFDDVHVHSDTRRAHLRHIKILLMTLRHYRFYLGSKKSEWFSKSLDSLGTIISDVGIEVDPPSGAYSAVADPAQQDRRPAFPRHRQLDARSPTTPLDDLGADHRVDGAIDVVALERARTAGFRYRQVPGARHPRPIDGAKVTSGEHKMYLFTDASRVGIGACLASGPNRSQAVPTRFFSTKFNGAQLNYHVTDKEFLAVVSACRAFEQHLIGYPFVIVTTIRPFAR